MNRNYIWSYVPLFINYILLIDSMIGIILNLNSLSNYLSLLNCIVIIIILLTTNSKILSTSLFMLSLIVWVSFYTWNIFIWFISFELVLIPMIYIISKGSASLDSRYRALMRFTIYTIFGGILLILSILLIIIKTGSYRYWDYLLLNNFDLSYELLLFPITTIPYLLKLPIIPFHLWLPK